jgi:4-hydroxythreonine-4-phosphate dehydrogenase
MEGKDQLEQKPLLAVTMGDPTGVGPETIVGAWANPALHDMCRMVVVGRPAVIRRAVALLNCAIDVTQVSSPEPACSTPTALPCLVCGSEDAESVTPATIDARGGQAAYDALVEATRLALSAQVDGIVTAPLNKAALWAAGHHYPGHTELLAERCGVDDFAMMLYLAPSQSVCGRVGLGVVHVTLHLAMRDVFDQITSHNILSRAKLADGFVKSLLADRKADDAPRIGIAAINPHAGEQGLFGDEERRIIRPAVEQGLAEGLLLDGPLPCDTLMMRAAGGEFDAVVAMYHDQGHIALKLLGMHRAVNITLGLPIVRTSVAHGTAFDLAWQGRAQTTGMAEAIRVAAMLARQRS